MLYSGHKKIKVCTYTYFHQNPDSTPDYLLLDSSFYFIKEKNPYLAASVPLVDANTVVLNLISSMKTEIPVIVGLCLTDPYKRIPFFAEKLKRFNYVKGFCNLPTNACIDGNFYQEITASQIGFEQELTAISQLSPKYDTLFFVFCMEQAVKACQMGIKNLVLSSSVPAYWNFQMEMNSDFNKTSVELLKKQFQDINVYELFYNQKFNQPISEYMDGAIWM